MVTEQKEKEVENISNKNTESKKYEEIYPEQLGQSREMAAKIVKFLDSKKAVNIKVIEIDQQTIIADFFVIATGTSSTHLKSLSNTLEVQLKEDEGLEPSRVSTSSDWVAIDYDSVIVHIFNREAREYYKLEKLWGDGVSINADNIGNLNNFNDIDNIDVDKLVDSNNE